MLKLDLQPTGCNRYQERRTEKMNWLDTEIISHANTVEAKVHKVSWNKSCSEKPD